MGGLLKIVLTGPESTGKSWLAEKLASHFQTTFCPEYARIYLEENGGEYDFDLITNIAKKHKQHQQQSIDKAKCLIFLDTDLINLAVWQEYKYQDLDPWLLNASGEETDHLYLLTFPDIDWQPDPLRENPLDRTALFEQHLEKIRRHNRPYAIIKGKGDKRLQAAINAVKQFLKSAS